MSSSPNDSLPQFAAPETPEAKPTSEPRSAPVSGLRVSLRGLLILTTIVFIVGYQQYQIRQLRQNVSQLEEDYKKQQQQQKTAVKGWTALVTPNTKGAVIWTPVQTVTASGNVTLRLNARLTAPGVANTKTWSYNKAATQALRAPFNSYKRITPLKDSPALKFPIEVERAMMGDAVRPTPARAR